MYVVVVHGHAEARPAGLFSGGGWAVVSMFLLNGINSITPRLFRVKVSGKSTAVILSMMPKSSDDSKTHNREGNARFLLVRRMLWW